VPACPEAMLVVDIPNYTCYDVCHTGDFKRPVELPKIGLTRLRKARGRTLARPSVIIKSPRNHWARYALATAAAAGVVAVCRAGNFGIAGNYALSVVAITIIAWRWGRGPALAALFLMALGGSVSLAPDPGSRSVPTALILSASLAFLAVLIASLVSVHRDESLQLAQLAFHDPLTRLPNRALFMDRLKQASARSFRHNRMIALMYLDFDDFKLINDRFGHAAGDAVLANVGDRLRNLVRDTDTVARLGGDEFAVLLEDVEDREAACIVARRLLDVLTYPTPYHTERLRCGASIGIAYANGGLPSPDELLRPADEALYRAKRDRKGSYVEAISTEAPPR
jgi:diguanylate cyclase (GGDEF)-like protein